MTPHNLKDWTRARLRDWFSERNERPFRADQVFTWLYQKDVGDWDGMSNLAKSTRQLLIENLHLPRLWFPGRNSRSMVHGPACPAGGGPR